MLGPGELERGGAVTRLQGVEAGSLEIEPADEPDRLLVVDDEDAAGVCAPGPTGRSRGLGSLLGLGEPVELLAVHTSLA